MLGNSNHPAKGVLPRISSRSFVMLTRNPRSEYRGTKRPWTGPTEVWETQDETLRCCRPQGPTTRPPSANGVRGNRGRPHEEGRHALCHTLRLLAPRCMVRTRERQSPPSGGHHTVGNSSLPRTLVNVTSNRVNSKGISHPSRRLETSLLRTEYYTNVHETFACYRIVGGRCLHKKWFDESRVPGSWLSVRVNREALDPIAAL